MRPLSPTRQRFLEFLIAIVVLHVAALVVYYGVDIPNATAQQQRVFAWVWLGATVVVVFIGLQRMKRARRPR